MQPFIKSLLATITDPPVVKSLTFAGISAACAMLAPVIGVVAGLIGIVYTLYRFRRDAIERTCDVKGCQHRHMPD